MVFQIKNELFLLPFTPRIGVCALFIKHTSTSTGASNIRISAIIISNAETVAVVAVAAVNEGTLYVS